MQLHDTTVHITVREGDIAGMLVSPPPRMPGVLLVHGWGGSQQQYQKLVRRVAALRCACLTFDLSGHVATRSQRETVTREDNLADVVAAYDFLAGHPQVDPSAMAVIGSSYGAYLATLLTGLRPVMWMALRAPALYKDSEWELPKVQLKSAQELARYRHTRVEPDDNRALRACAAFRGDVLLVESECDTIVPAPVLANYRRACVEASSLTFRTIAGADHALSDEGSRLSYAAIVLNWLREMLAGARSSPHPGD